MTASASESNSAPGARGIAPNCLALLTSSGCGLNSNLVSQFCWAIGSLALTASRTVAAAPTSNTEQILVGISSDEITSSSLPSTVRWQSSGSDANIQSLVGILPADCNSVLDWLERAVRVQSERGGGAWEGEPDEEPITIHEVATALLSPYVVRDGHVQLAGCTLDETPHLRIGRRVDETVEYVFIDPNGKKLSPKEIDQRGLGALHHVNPRLRRSDFDSIQRWVLASDGEGPGLVDLTVVWSRRAVGKIVVQFCTGPSVSIIFDDWARDFARGLARPPKYHCALSGMDSYNIVMLDDGTVTVAEAIEQCEVSGIESLRDRLAICELTGKRVSQHLLQACAETGKFVLSKMLQPCDWCGQTVVPSQLSEGRCGRCRARTPMSEADPALLEIIKRNQRVKGLLGAGKLSGWIGPTVGVLVSSGVFQEKMVAFDVATGVIFTTGVRQRLLGRWRVNGC